MAAGVARSPSDELGALLLPYMEKDGPRFQQSKSFFICPIEESWNPDPQPYRFALRFSGRSLDELLECDPEDPVLSCHVDHWSSERHEITVGDVVWRIMDVKQYQQGITEKAPEGEHQ